MRKIRDFFSKWRVQLIMMLIPITLGIVGYTGYYRTRLNGAFPDIWDPFISTIRLFALVLEAKRQEGETGREWYFIALCVARYFALFQSANIVLRVIRPLIERFWEQAYYRLGWMRRHTRLLLIGNNPRNREILDSAGRARHGLIACEEGDDCEVLERDRVPHLRMDPVALLLEQVDMALEGRGALTVIINTGDDEKNLRLCKAVASRIVERIAPERAKRDALCDAMARGDAGDGAMGEIVDIERRIVQILRRLDIVVFGDKQFKSIYLELQQESLGVLRYTNVYQMVAWDFVTRYPLTRYLRGPWARLLDGRGCVIPGADFNVMMVGFGDTNQEIFLNSCAINQFVTREDGGIPRPVQVCYHIYDRDNVKNNQYMNHTLFRYCQDFRAAIRAGRVNAEDYLPLPEDPARVCFHQVDIGEAAFYDGIYDICTANPDSMNAIVVAYADDLRNIDLAQRLSVKKREWGLDNLHIFVKVRDGSNAGIARTLEGGDYAVFGVESFTLDDILNGDMERMARGRNLMYALEAYGDLSPSDAEVRAAYSWHMMDNLKRMSNLYAVMSFRMKLQLIGLDYAVKGEGSAPLGSNADYFARYAADGMPEKRATNGECAGKELYAYDKIFPEAHYARGLIRENLAVQEHYRWNALMIVNGFVPIDRARMLSGTIRDYALRAHGNLTTFEGLFEYRRMIARHTGRSEADADVIKWDCQLMDDAWWFLNENGYEMVEV